jgi:hypothetical protein
MATVRRHTLLMAVAFGALLAITIPAVAAASEGDGPQWRITSVAGPENFAPGSTEDVLVLTAINVGGGATDGSTVTITDELPLGLTAVRVKGFDLYRSGVLFGAAEKAPLVCAGTTTVTCTESGPVDTGDTLHMTVTLGEIGPGLPENLTNDVAVSGGGATSASATSPVTISSAPASFGVAPDSVVAATSTLQAGAHPDLTTLFSFNKEAPGYPAGSPKDIRFDLPRGLVGNTVGVPRCSMFEAVQEIVKGPGGCPTDAIVGIATIFVAIQTGMSPEGSIPIVVPVYNIAPAPGEPAAFGFNAVFFPVRLDASVLSDGNYGVRVTSPDINEGGAVISTAITIWGVPADHNGPGPDKTIFAGFGGGGGGTFGGPSQATRVPLLTNPTQCSTPLTATLAADSWQDPGAFSAETVQAGTLTGCARVPFSTSFTMLPDTLAAGAPAGYDFDLQVPREQDTTPDGVAAADVSKTVVTLPMGTVISPSIADGLAACNDDPGVDPANVANEFGLHSLSPASCDRASQIGTVQITSPLIANPLDGEVFLARPNCEPCTPEDAQDGQMARLLLQAQGEGSDGVLVKVEGSLSINQQTGQLTATFDETPQLPFNELKLTLGGGPRAALANPRTCGPATTTAQLTPWSTPFSPEATPTYTFDVNEGCLSPRFDPSFVAGTTSIQAGEYSPFTLSFGREDADEFLDGLQMQMPPGLLGSLAAVPLCPEPRAAAGTCGAASLIGHTQVLTGPGADPFLVTGGQVFLTVGYKGAPFGLSIVVPAKAGPYTLSGTTGNGTVVVRAAINIDPHSAALTVTSDPLPTTLDGIPLQLRRVDVSIDRPGFTFNPTNCDKLQISGRLTSKESAGASVDVPFQVTNCGGLGFKPQFKVSTSGHTSRLNGASLDAKVIYPLGPKLANIAKVKVALPKQLPSRLTTLQHACPAATFNANPGACPAGSLVGIAKASTPILPVMLSGPVYFVSNGGEAFPNLIVVLQGYGIRVDLVGDTFINKAGITSSTFNQVPDVPISSFELYLPEGANSALAANGNLCKSSLKMPTEFVAQNGLKLKQSTAIAVTGCAAKADKARKARVAGRRHVHRKRNGKARGAHRHGNGRGNNR